MTEQTLHFLAPIDDELAAKKPAQKPMAKPTLKPSAAPYTAAQAKQDYTKWKVANTAYHNDSAIMTDAEFDKLTRKLAPFYPNVLTDVGAAPKAKHASARKVRLEVPMNSLDKVFAGRNELERARKSKIGTASSVVIAEKVDGASLQLRCDSKGVRKLYTRGKNGLGQDVSHLLPYLDKFKVIGRIAAGETIRFELVIPRGASKALDADDAKKRNAISGVINARTPNLDVLRKAWAVALAYMEPHLAPSRAYKKLKTMGWRTPKHLVVKASVITETYLTAMLNSWHDKARYDMDGLVVFADVAEKPAITNPKRAFAWKVDAEAIQTKIIRVIWQVSRYGRMTPVCEIEPVMVDGVRVTRATAHNAAYVKLSKLGPGAVIGVIRSGAVIPKIVEVISGAAKASFPAAGTYEWDANKTHIITIKAEHTGDAAARQLVEFFGTRGLNVNGFGPSVAALVAKKSVKQIVEMTALDWTKVGGGNAVSREMPGKIKAALEQSTVPKLMAKSGVFGSGFGDSSARDLWDVMSQAKKPKTVKELTKALSELAGWSDESARDVAKKWLAWVKWFNALPVKPSKKAAKKAVKKGPLVGSVFVFTQVRDKALEASIEQNGGAIGSSVTKATTHVIYADGQTSIKRTKGEEMKLQVIPYSKARAKLKL